MKPMSKISTDAIQNLVFVLFLSILMIGCAGPIIDNPNIKSLKMYKKINVDKWKNTKVQVAEGDAVILTPLYPKGFIYPIRGKIGNDGEVFDALDIDIGDIYTVKSPGTLHIGLDKRSNFSEDLPHHGRFFLGTGLDKRSNPIQAGVFIFQNNNLENIISDLSYFGTKEKDVKIANLTIGILLMEKGNRLILNNKYAEALQTLDKALHCFSSVDEKLYATTIYRLHKTKASLYKKNKDFEKFDDSLRSAMESLMKASKYYTQIKDYAFNFLQKLTKEELFLLLIKSHWKVIFIFFHYSNSVIQ